MPQGKLLQTWSSSLLFHFPRWCQSGIAIRNNYHCCHRPIQNNSIKQLFIKLCFDFSTILISAICIPLNSINYICTDHLDNLLKQILNYSRHFVKHKKIMSNSSKPYKVRKLFIYYG